MKFRLSLVLSVLFLCSCGLFSGKKPLLPADPDPATVQRFQLGIQALDNEKYDQALKIFDGLIQSDPTSEFEVVALFNSAAALEGLGQCEESSKRYRKVGQLSPDRSSRLRAQSIFRLSYTYECMNQDAKVVAALLETLKRPKLFEPEVIQAEVPARLAAAYARMNEMKTAQRYLDDAERGMLALSAIWENSAQKRELIAKTYFLMGRPKVTKIEIDPVKPETLETFDRFAQNLDLLQGYLMRSIYVNVEPWSKKSQTELLDSHDIMWNKIQETNRLSVKEADYQVVHQAKGKLAERALRSIEVLKLMRLPDKDEPAVVERIYNEINKKEKRLHEFIAKMGPTNPLTPEAKARQSLKKEGRVVDKKSRLETESLSRKLPSKKNGK